MKQWQEIVVPPQATIRETIAVIDRGAVQLAIVTDGDYKLRGTVTDGDIRRAILADIPLDSPVETVMNRRPTVAHIHDSKEKILLALTSRHLRQIPVVDEDLRVVGIELLESMVAEQKRANCVVLMAGGAGVRLRPLTEECPKPLLRVGNKPLLETILENFITHGFCKFYISVNYKADMVRDYFGDGSRWDVDVRYLDETRRMGTAGCLSLLPERPEEPLLVMNGDLLTKVNFGHLLDFHIEHKSAATMCVREYDFQVPYGVVRLDRERLLSIDEKPVQRFFVNAGIYVLDPEVIDLVPHETECDMPDLLRTVVASGRHTAVFPIREYWLDIGQMDDFHRANGDFEKNFG